MQNVNGRVQDRCDSTRIIFAGLRTPEPLLLSFELLLGVVSPLPPASIGIMGLAIVCGENLENKALTRKIFRNKDLGSLKAISSPLSVQSWLSDSFATLF